MNVQQIAAPITADDEGLAALQSGLAGALVLAGGLLSPPRRVSVAALGDLSDALVIIEGLDRNDKPIREAFVGPNAGAALSKYVYAHVTQILIGRNYTDVKAGWTSESLTAWIPANANASSWRTRAFIEDGGTANYDVELTSDEFDTIVGDVVADLEKAAAGVTSDYSSANDVPVGAVRLRVHSQDAAVVLRALFG